MVMQEFIHAQMTCHARAMELYTAAYQHTQAISEDEIVEASIQLHAGHDCALNGILAH